MTVATSDAEPRRDRRFASTIASLRRPLVVAYGVEIEVRWKKFGNFWKVRARRSATRRLILHQVISLHRSYHSYPHPLCI